MRRVALAMLGGAALVAMLARAGEAQMADGGTPVSVKLVEGVPADLSHGVRVTLTGVMYAHLSGSKNESRMVLEVSGAGARNTQVSLSRLEPGPPHDETVGPLKLGIDWVDAYHRPSTGAVFVLPDPR